MTRNPRRRSVQYNYSHYNDGGFLLICNEGGHDPSENVGNIDTIVRYNISQNDHHRGINIAGPVSNTTIYNNTIYVGEGERVDLVLQSDWKDGGWHIVLQQYFLRRWRSAIFLRNFQRPGWCYLTAAGVAESRRNVFDYNLYFGKLSRWQVTTMR